MVDKKTGVKPQQKTKSKKQKAVKKAELVAETAPVDKPVKEKLKVEKVEPKTITKAGKRSAKALKETEEKQAKEVRKAKAAKGIQDKPKIPQKPPRSKLERAGKKYRDAAKLIDKQKTYDLAEAVELATKTSPVKFDASVEMHFNLNVDPKQADQYVRGVVNLPAGSGKIVRVAVLAEGDDLKKATEAGADIVGSDDLLAKFDKGEINFDSLITTAALMPRLGKYAKLLGPKGLMPNPKSGTITANIAEAVKAAKAGKVEYRVDASGIIHLSIGKVSFGGRKLADNAKLIVASIKAARPASLKGVYLNSVYITTTMGPSIKVSI